MIKSVFNSNILLDFTYNFYVIYEYENEGIFYKFRNRLIFVHFVINLKGYGNVILTPQAVTMFTNRLD